jgi:hypothetical protein
VARDGVELPTPAFSGVTETVLEVTYKDVEGCEDPVRTGKRQRKRARTAGWLYRAKLTPNRGVTLSSTGLKVEVW